MNVLKDLIANPARYKKWIAALIGFATVVVAQGALTGSAAKWVAIAAAFATQMGVYTARNSSSVEEDGAVDLVGVGLLVFFVALAIVLLGRAGYL